MTIILSENDLRRLFPHANEDVMQSVSAEWNTTLARYGINDTKKRLLYFLAETAEETNNWQSMVEGGNSDVYKGRGLIQLTNHANYQQIGAKLARDFPDTLNFDLVEHPELAATPPYVLKTAVAWWDVNGVNKICDTGTFLQVSLKVNGRNPSTGLPNGWTRRQAELARITNLLGNVLGPEAGQGAEVNPSLGIGATGSMVSALQTMLQKAGYDVGDVDGKFGSLTRAALLAFQADQHLVPTGVADADTYAALNAPGERPLSNERITATISDLIQRGSRTAIDGRRANWMGLAATILGALGIGNSTAVGIANNTKTATEAAHTPTQANVGDQLTATIQQLQDLITGLPATVNSANLKTQAQPILDALKALGTGDLGQGSDFVNASLQRIHALLQQQPSAATAKTADALVTQLIALSHSTAPAIHGATEAARTIFDVLPPDALGSTVTPILAAAANTVLPGFGGALVTLGLGVATQIFSKGVLNARVEDHRTAANVNR